MKAAVGRQFGEPLVIETRPLTGVNEAIAEVLRGKAKARLLLQP
jgi:hypothetical protein